MDSQPPPPQQGWAGGQPPPPQNWPAPSPAAPQQGWPAAPPAAAPDQGWPAPAAAAAPPVQQPPAPPLIPAPPAGPQTVRTDAQAKDGLTKCASCGATDIALNIATGQLRCNFCRFEWSTPNAMATYHLDGPVAEIVGTVIGSGSADIVPTTETVLTFKCSACGAEVVIDTDEAMQARCHWCRNTLSMNQQIENGAVPDMVLPFSLAKQLAIDKINEFVGRRKFFAHPRFKAEFNADNVMGVYLPYMIIDVNGRAHLSGEGEHKTRSYTVKRGDKQVRLYDADVYAVARDFALYVDDLTVESSTARMDQRGRENSNNIINSIMPFDVENSVCYDGNYLAGFTSERRDSNMETLAPIVTAQAQDIARHQANSTIAFYDRGVRWDNEQLSITGQRWVSAYLPVWLYSYYEQRGEKSFTHYVAVNGRTGETMGSVPINRGRLILVSAIVEVIALIVAVILLVVMS